MKKITIPLICLLLLISLTLACGTSSALDPVQPAPVVRVTGVVAPTLPPENTPEPTASPAPTQPVYVEAVLMAEVNGTGKTVTDNLNLPACGKAVFLWKVAPSSYGTASLILSLFKKGSEREITVVNDMAMDAGSEGMSGSSLQPLTGGEYFFSSDNTNEPWSVRIECQDGAAPVAAGMDIQGTGNLVTANYELQACQKSVFHWQVEPGTGGTAALILGLCGAECQTIANEMKMDMTGPLEGQSLQAVNAGIYYLVTENASGRPWHVTWECKD
ncbi:MAG: hypothetical protein NTW32_21145 [Chloroflexi bacterium]|nr:hypothetical protein [Chloroflexota bacterium]